MKVFFKILIVVVIAAIAAGYFYLQQNKKSILKNTVQQAVKNKTDSLYYLHYDSSAIDEVNGNASFYNVTLQSDSLQKSILQNNNNLPAALYNISISEITVRGIDMAGMLQKQNLSAKSIVLVKPVIQIMNTGAEHPAAFTYDDTLALYKKITGRFNSIQADTITVENATVLITDKKGKPLTTIENIRIRLNKFLIDSSRNYRNIISYFIKDVVVTVENIQLPENKNGSRINITSLLYDAPKKLLQAGTVQQYLKGNTTPVSNLKNVQLNGLNTDVFINKQKFIADKLSSGGGLITIYKKNKKTRLGVRAIEMSTVLIDEVHIDGIQLADTKIIIADSDGPDESPFIINKAAFTASKLSSLANGSTINNLINTASWQLSAGGFSLLTKNGLYRLTATGLQLNNQDHSVKIRRVLLQPQLTEAAFVKKSKVQADLFDMAFTDINLKEVDFEKLINENVLEIEGASLQTKIKIFNDRTLPFDTTSKIGKYPHQAILKLPFPFYIRTLTVKNSAVYYKEKARKSGMTGIPFFSNINAMVTNVTNIQAKIKQQNIMGLKATALFMGKGLLHTQWRLPLNLTDTSFTVTGQLNAMDATLLNKITEPLAMASVKTGTINKLSFNLKCTDYKGQGQVTFLYNNLKAEVLKMSDDTLKKKGFVSFVANTFIKNNNPSGSGTYTGDADYKRDTQKSFFNLLWKSVFDGVKKTVLKK
jgi:hypothetical protein